MMSAPGRGSALLMSSHRVCAQCARTTPRRTTIAPNSSQPSPVQPLPLIARRYYAAETASASVSSSQTTIPPPPVTSSSETESATATDPLRYKIKSSLILTRPPLLTREQTPFESAFYLYQKRLNERLTAPFCSKFYFKKDTAADLDWRIKLRERHGVPAKDIGRYNPRGRMAWNDEVLVGSKTSDPQEVVDRLLADAEVRVSEDGEPIAPEERVPVERPMPRRTEADEKNDVRRLDRKLDRTLYLVVRKGEGEDAVWEFPGAIVPTQETLHETAARALAEAAGVNMNTWIVGRVPVAHHIVKPVFREDGKVAERGVKVFFLKGRIMAGQADLTGNKHRLTDFKWLTHEELKEVLPNDYYRSVRGMFELR
ncbi:39S mitochondrial ribosomal protein L46-domain-containing protein [Achaetomium macrosporum]|uniref:Large ribosomal subunit protein mL46 n=1 Tax=Achaetomium macrosporum TaxID=79813 RepID=A0AAN7HGL1_9PEZI|nr:39S mitochondrial ribosomal protein L46-domain-containing protein [Achaetomium macrosporum]